MPVCTVLTHMTRLVFFFFLIILLINHAAWFPFEKYCSLILQTSNRAFLVGFRVPVPISFRLAKGSLQVLTGTDRHFHIKIITKNRFGLLLVDNIFFFYPQISLAEH